MTPGRSCPLGYRYAASSFARWPAVEADTFYVVGGLYGNLDAWRAIERLFADEPGERKQLLLNGDFHWFDVDPALFAAVEAATRPHHRLRGNVETELASPTDDAGCGCAYPDAVDDATVERSNRILGRLRETARRVPGAVDRLARLAMQATAQVGGLRLGIVHGDAESLAGWGFDAASLAAAGHQAQLRRWFSEAGVHAFASSHTCGAALRRIPLAAAGEATDARQPTHGIVINNGAAGMPCFTGLRHGVISRIATTPAPAHVDRLYGTVQRTADGDVHIDAIAVPFDAGAWDERFLSMWPPGSDAHLSYWSRLQHGPASERPVA